MPTATPAPAAQPRQSTQPSTKSGAPKAMPKPQTPKNTVFTDFASI
ncbi:hypothetical protein OO012_18270 [Rhodobacteraceae bacterium KMM 6894]|nr:hypothetical protein [Rhodobacteraceae bacterium KMM 6894]